MHVPRLQSWLRIAAWLGLAWLLSHAGPAAAATGKSQLLPRRELATTTPAATEKLRRAARLRSVPPFRVTTARERPRLPQGLRRSQALAQTGEVDTVHILVARIGFATNRAPNLTSMAANGDFLLDFDANAIIDPPPHEVAYFQAHLLALRSYYDIMSRGRLVVEGEVFPPEGEPSLKLGDIADYGPGAGGRWTLEAFERYFRDAVGLLDREAAGKLDLTPYTYDPTGKRLGSIVLAHPGSDLQNDINQDSPNDLPTFFITLVDSVPVQGGSGEVRWGLVLPEATIQDGLLGSIQGPLCHEFGHLLGLPDWYDTRFGLPAVGEWSLMDSGSAAVFAFVLPGNEEQPIFALGLLPTGLSAMDRVLLGWEEPTVLRAPQDSVVLRPPNGDAAFGDFPTCARLDVSPEEYFLVENRRDLLGRRIPLDVDFCPYLNRDADTGVVLWMSKDDANKPSRERHNTGEYDFWISAPSAPDSIPNSACGESGFGLLVWHVDERPLAEGLPTNSVNNDERYRALRVVEASGDYEIGDWRLPTASFYGDGWNDAFRQGFYTELRAQTVPNNWNNDWALTGWEITNVVTSRPEAHVLHARTLDGVAGWPQTFRVAPDSLLQVEPRSALVTTVSGLGNVIALVDSTALHLFSPAARADLLETGLHPGSLAATGPSFAGDAFGTLAALDVDSLRLWQANWDGTTLPPRSGFPLQIPGGAGGRLVLAEAEGIGVAETADGAWLPFNAAGFPGSTFDLEPGREDGIVVGNILPEPPGPQVAEVALVGRRQAGSSGPRLVLEIYSLPGLQRLLQFGPDDLPLTETLYVGGGRLQPGATAAQIVVMNSRGALRVVDAANGAVLHEYRDLPADDYLGFALADLDADGALDLVATSATRIAGCNSRGARLFSTPRAVQDLFALRSATHIVTPPVVADVTGDALPEILCSTDTGLLYALDASGALVPGYPRKVLPDLYPAALLAEDLDGVRETREVIAVSSASASVFSLPGGASESPGWVSLGAGAARTSFATAAPAGPVGGPGTRLAALEQPFLAYPNPARGQQVLLRITASSEGPYEIRIYNLEGELVFENHGVAHAGAAQEIPWSVSHLASGVYLCRFVSVAAGVPSPLVERISVLR